MHTKYSLYIIFTLLFVIAITGCSFQTKTEIDYGPSHRPTAIPTLPTLPTSQEPTAMPPTGKVGRANVESIEIVMRESMPMQISANIKGTVSDSCTQANPITQERDGNTFRITVGATRPQGAMCAQVITPFEQSVALDAVGLKAGTYTVEANGATQTFDLASNNILP